MSTIIDARGMMCPKPLIMAKKAINDTSIAGAFDLLIDNATSKENVERFLGDNGFSFHTLEDQGTYTMTVSKEGKAELTAEPGAWCTPRYDSPNTTGHVVCVRSSIMGAGSSELGEILIKAFINTIDEIKPLPYAVVFYNSGVMLALQDSPVILSLEKLVEKGVKVLVCGTCSDYFSVKDKIGVGTISNMYEILETLSAASKVVYP